LTTAEVKRLSHLPTSMPKSDLPDIVGWGPSEKVRGPRFEKHVEKTGGDGRKRGLLRCPPAG
jgi:hypothetical protein